MIQFYSNGEEFIQDNEEFLKSYPYLSTFFFYDAPLLKEHTIINYSFKVEEINQKLVVMKVEPFDVMFLGELALAKQAITTIFENGYEFNNYLCEQNLGFEIKKILSENYQLIYDESLAMDYMICDHKTIESDSMVEIPTEEDVNRIYEGMLNFVKDCNLEDEVNKERLIKNLTHYRVIKENGIVSSIAIKVLYNDKEGRISNVYTFPESRGKGYARKIVNSIKNEIIDSGRIATLNVDQFNPISNHIYKSIGFERIFSQGEFRKKK